MSSVNQVKNYLDKMISKPAGDNISEELISSAYEQFRNGFDEEYGGFFRAPKFPSPHNLIFLMRYRYSYDNEFALDMVTKTLNQMRLGGIYDQIGFGFHRYSTDKRWLVPHFEKMLYDQAILVQAYLDAYEATGKQYYANIVNEILEYVIRDMTSKEGAYYSAEDADSEGVEGKYYVWENKELKNRMDNFEIQLDTIKKQLSQKVSIYDNNSGSGYRSAQSVYVTNPTTFATVPESEGLPTVDSNLNTILTPISGHGFDPEKELGAKTLMITCDFEDAESNVGTSDIASYRKIGLLLNPIVATSSQDDISATGTTITSGTRAQGTSYGLSSLLKYSGQLLYVEHRAKVTRTSPNTYRARIVIDF